jgi:mono/diheme cytochrome c family protein
LDRIRQWIVDGALEVPAALPEAPTSEAVVGVTWQDVADLFQDKCGACHSSATKLGGLDVSSYQATLAGGSSGPAVQPGDAGASSLVTLQAAGGHPGQFSPEELEQIRLWIASGALEQ